MYTPPTRNPSVNRRRSTLWLWTAMLSMAPAAFGTDVDDATLSPGDRFRDCPACPEMVVVPAGEFMMGSPEDEEDRWHSEGPRHKVRIAKPFAVGVYEVTFDEWDACVRDSLCEWDEGVPRFWRSLGRPVRFVSWDDARDYVIWLSGTTGRGYRLLSESEWEYVARAGTITPFHFGPTISRNQASYYEPFYPPSDLFVGQYPANDFGLHDVHGSVWEWVQDWWHDTYDGAPGDGRAWEWDEVPGRHGSRVLRGGSVASERRHLRSAVRAMAAQPDRSAFVGFRVAGTLDGSRELLNRYLLNSSAPRTVALLLEGGASAAAVHGAGWTALHGAAAWGWSLGRKNDVVRLLIDAGADVNAATDVVGWTPLHLAAADPEDEAVGTVETLLAAGADPNARTRVGGWTPLFVASRRGAGAEVVAALEKAGATSSVGDATPFAIPAWRDWGRSVPGSFTRPAARERLVFEPMGEPLGGGNLTAVGVVDEHGTTMLGWTSRGRRHFLGLCRDAATEVDHVMVERWPEGNCCANELEFWAHDAAAGALRLAYSFEMLGVGGFDGGPEPQASTAWPDEDGRCRWRERKAAGDTLSRALETLQVGALPSFGEAGPTRLPTRALAGDVVAPLVEAVRGMPPELAETRDVLIALAWDELADGWSRTRVIESDRWEILAITGSGRGADGRLRSDEVILVHDRSNQAWHSMLDCADLEATDLRGDVLLAEMGDTSGGCGDDSGPRREVRIDLGTWEVRSVPAPDGARVFLLIGTWSAWQASRTGARGRSGGAGWMTKRWETDDAGTFGHKRALGSPLHGPIAAAPPYGSGRPC